MLRLRRMAAAPVVVHGQTIGTVLVQAGRPSEFVAREIGPVLLLIALALVIGVGALAAVLVFRPANRRLQELAATATRLGAGDTSARASEAGGDEIAGVAQAFNRMADDLTQRAEALQVSDRVRRQLLADVSHELMTPLTAIRGYLETLEMPSIALNDDTRTRYLEIVREESLRLERIVGDLLDLARLEAGGGEFRLEDVPIGPIFARVLERHGHAAGERGVTLDSRGDQTILVRADPMRLEQALQNLAANALRHVPSGGAVVLDVERRDGRRGPVGAGQRHGHPARAPAAHLRPLLQGGGLALGRDRTRPAAAWACRSSRRSSNVTAAGSACEASPASRRCSRSSCRTKTPTADRRVNRN